MLDCASPARRVRSVLSLLFPALALILFCSGAARADSFTTGDFVTYEQAEWSVNPTAINLLQADFEAVYATAGGTLQVGIGESLFFDSANALITYLPSTGIAAPLNSDLVDPTTSSSGIFGGDVVALRLNTDFSAFGLLPGTSSLPFGDLILTGFNGTVSSLNGTSVGDLLILDETLLGGGSNGYAIGDLESVTSLVNGAFTTGAVTTFAMDHLELPTTTPPVTTPEPSSLLLLASGLVALGMGGYWQRRQEIVLSDAAFQPKGN